MKGGQLSWLTRRWLLLCKTACSSFSLYTRLHFSPSVSPQFWSIGALALPRGPRLPAKACPHALPWACLWELWRKQFRSQGRKSFAFWFSFYLLACDQSMPSYCLCLRLQQPSLEAEVLWHGWLHAGSRVNKVIQIKCNGDHKNNLNQLHSEKIWGFLKNVPDMNFNWIQVVFFPSRGCIFFLRYFGSVMTWWLLTFLKYEMDHLWVIWILCMFFQSWRWSEVLTVA